MGQNPHLQRIGKFLIAWVILECEARYAAEKRNPNSVTGADNWCRFIIHKLTNGCRKSADLHKNEVRFITFNYDTSLERALYGGLSSIDLFKKEDIEAFFLTAVFFMSMVPFEIVPHLYLSFLRPRRTKTMRDIWPNMRKTKISI